MSEFRGRRDRMVVRFTTTYAINAYHYFRCEFELHSHEVYLIQHYAIKFVSDLRQVCGFLRVPRFSTNKTDRSDKTEILLKVALNTITLIPWESSLLYLHVNIHVHFYNTTNCERRYQISNHYKSQNVLS